jgi:hypothetical protein
MMAFTWDSDEGWVKTAFLAKKTRKHMLDLDLDPVFHCNVLN